MLTKRIIPCLDIKNGRTVKGVMFEDIRDAGDPVELAALYAQQGADELVFLDITATNEKRKTLRELVREVARHIDIPFTVGGGISCVADVEVLLQNGADKVSINSSAIHRPELITELASRFGSQCVTVAIDTKNTAADGWKVFSKAGTEDTGLGALAWARETVERGAGEILLTSMSNDGTKNGFALDITGEISRHVHVPVIASGGAGNQQHFLDVFEAGADAALAASIFHFQEVPLPRLKQFLAEHQIAMRY